MGQTELDAFRKTLEKRWKDSTELFPDLVSVKKIEVIPSSSALLNLIMGVGGFPRGRITEISGPYSSGKTTIATEVVASCQKMKKEMVALYVDYEHAFDGLYARKLGVNLSPDRFLFVQPEYFEQGADIVLEAVTQSLCDLVVIDSTAAMTPKTELEGTLEQGSAIGIQARLMSTFLSRLTKRIPRGRHPAVVLVNQTRMHIDTRNPRNNKEKPAGGKAIDFYTSIRLQLEIAAAEGEEGRGSKGAEQLHKYNTVRVTCTKNKLAPPWMRGKIKIVYGEGIDNVASIAELAEARLGIVNGQGYVKYTGDTANTSISTRGREALIAELKQNPALLKEIEGKVLGLIKQDHAKSLGVEEITVSGDAKVVEEEPESDATVYVSTETGEEVEGMPVAKD